MRSSLKTSITANSVQIHLFASWAWDYIISFLLTLCPTYKHTGEDVHTMSFKPGIEIDYKVGTYLLC